MSKFASLIAGALIAAVGVNAQAAPNWAYIPTACESQCAQTIETSYLCQQENGNSGTQTYGCFCAAYPSDAAGCATCLNDNNSAALGALLAGTEQDCPNAIRSCTFACAFDTCQSDDVACQCDASYLANIYNCGACNTANGNTGATQESDFEALRDSCANQNFTGAAQSFTTRAGNTPTGQDSYQAPTLTASGGGIAATGDASALAAVTESGNGSGAAPNPTASEASGASSTSRSVTTSRSMSRTMSGGASASASESAAGAGTSGNAAYGLTAPAGGILAMLAGAIALF